jgi:type IV pilus assembly protein PilF
VARPSFQADDACGPRRARQRGAVRFAGSSGPATGGVSRVGVLRRGLLAATLLVSLGACSGMGPPAAPSAQLVTASDQTNIQRRAQIRLQLAISYYEQNQLVVALDEVKQSLAIDPTSVDALGVRALIYMEMQETKLADESFQAALKLAPDNPDLVNNYGWFLCQNNRPKESIAYFDKALATRGFQSPVKALNNAGACYLKLRDDEAALAYLQRAMMLEPRNQETNANLARLYLARNDTERARFYSGNMLRSDNLSAASVWVGIKVSRQVGDTDAAASLANQLRRNHSTSREYGLLMRGAFNE